MITSWRWSSTPVSLRSGSVTARLPCAQRGSIGLSHGLLLGERQISRRQPPSRLTRRLWSLTQPWTSRLTMPSGIVRHQRQHAHALSREALGHPGEEGAGHRAHRPARHEPQQHPLAPGQPQAIAGQRLRLGVRGIGGMLARRRRSPGAAQACRAGWAKRENQTSSSKPSAQSGRPWAKLISRSRRRFFARKPDRGW